MALTQCPECGREVSTDASACPGCGKRMTPACRKCGGTSWRRKERSHAGEGIGFGVGFLLCGLFLGLFFPWLGGAVALFGLVGGAVMAARKPERFLVCRGCKGVRPLK